MFIPSPSRFCLSFYHVEWQSSVPYNFGIRSVTLNWDSFIHSSLVIIVVVQCSNTPWVPQQSTAWHNAHIHTQDNSTYIPEMIYFLYITVYVKILTFICKMFSYLMQCHSWWFWLHTKLHMNETFFIIHSSQRNIMVT